MSLVARAPAFVRQQALRSRIAPSRGAHGEYKHMPFKTEQSKPVFGAKVGVFLLAGFLVPAAAASYQLKKAGAGA
ncbi:hypothetical protein BV25DRAFT_1818042 [Artomyces pyxidatus]|uniref:Uncharacterized protein n=1 Tax=Artomyces pyxidatus TaxID=48021 RepID=A0ACB8TKW4_9AGAM|nr:hypothetical protein BV25DRAFT_1818042 [Artomyces pyxidatus]